MFGGAPNCALPNSPLTPPLLRPPPRRAPPQSSLQSLQALSTASPLRATDVALLRLISLARVTAASKLAAMQSRHGSSAHAARRCLAMLAAAGPPPAAHGAPGAHAALLHVAAARAHEALAVADGAGGAATTWQQCIQELQVRAPRGVQSGAWGGGRGASWAAPAPPESGPLRSARTARRVRAPPFSRRPRARRPQAALKCVPALDVDVFGGYARALIRFARAVDVSGVRPHLGRAVTRGG